MDCSQYEFLEKCKADNTLTADGILDCENFCGLEPEPVEEEEVCEGQYFDPETNQYLPCPVVPNEGEQTEGD